MITFPSLLDLTGKERGTVNDGWRIESAASAATHPVERAKMATLMEAIEIVADDGGCVWMALNVPSVAPSIVVVARFATAGGF